MNSRTLTLLKFRYTLLWAQVRTSKGQIVLLFLVYLALLVVALVLVLGGFGAALAGTQTGNAEETSRGLLTGLMTSGIMSSIFFGIGPRAAFSDAVLRRYPLTRVERLAVRHFLGIIDPIWAMVLASTLGLAIGLAVLGQASWLWAIVGAVIFVIASYFVAILVLSILNRILQSREGSTALKMIALGLITFSALGISWFFERGGIELLAPITRAMRFAPSGLAARVMTSLSASTALVSLMALTAWSLLLFLLLYLVESIPEKSAASQVGSINWNNPFDTIARILGGRYPSLFAKSLRYHLRSNRVRFGLISSPMIALIGKLVARDQMASIEFYFALGFFVALTSGTSTLSLNHFGLDGPGIVRYGLLPSSFAAPVRAGSLVAVFLGLLLIVPTAVLWALITNLTIDWRMIAMLCSNGIFGAFLFGGGGMLISVMWPRRGEFSSVLGNQLSIGANIFVIGVVFGIFAISFGLAKYRIETVLKYWWVSAVAAIAGLLFYLLMWRIVGPVANARREKLMVQIAG